MDFTMKLIFRMIKTRYLFNNIQLFNFNKNESKLFAVVKTDYWYQHVFFMGPLTQFTVSKRLFIASLKLLISTLQHNKSNAFNISYII